MAFVSELVDQLRDTINDAADTQVPFTSKKMYLNRGIARLWPNVWKANTSDVALTTGVSETYTLVAGAANGFIISVERNSLADTSAYIRFDDYDIVFGDEDLAAKIRVTVPTETGTTLRIRYAMRVPMIAAASYAASQSESWDGPDDAMGLPVLYALSMIAARKVDDRQDTLRYSTTQATNGVEDQDIMSLAQMWMGQFELELASYTKLLPPALD